MILTGIVMGVLGTLAMDIWALVLTLFGQARPNWAMPRRRSRCRTSGRWAGRCITGSV